MAKKDLANVTANLASLAEALPTQSPASRSQTKTPARDSKPDEPVLQFSLSMRASLRKELVRLANEADMTMRAYVLSALREKGLSVTAEDLVDMRKRS